MENIDKPTAGTTLLAPLRSGNNHDEDGNRITPPKEEIAEDVRTIKEIAKNLGMKMDLDTLADKMFTISSLYDNFCVEAISEVFSIDIEVIEDIAQRINRQINEFNVQNVFATNEIAEIYFAASGYPDIDEVMETLKEKGINLIPESIVSDQILMLRDLSKVMDESVKKAVAEYEKEHQKKAKKDDKK